MGKGGIQIYDHNNRDDWLMDRKCSFGGSDVPALCGASPFASPLEVIERKRGTLQPVEATLPMHIGHAVEGGIAELFCRQTGYQVIDHGDYTIARNTLAQRMHATEDREYSDGLDGRCTLEMKWVGPGMRRHWDEGDAPPYVQIQLQAAMLCTGSKRGAIAALGVGQGFAVYFYEFDPEFAAKLVEVCAAAWQYVADPDLDIPVGASGRDLATIKQLYPLATKGRVARLPDALVDRHLRLKTLKAQRAAIDAEVDEHEAHIRSAIKDAEFAVSEDGTFGYSMKTVQRKAHSVAASSSRPLKAIRSTDTLQGLCLALPQPKAPKGLPA